MGITEFCSQCGTVLLLPLTAPTIITCNYCHSKCRIRTIRNELVCRVEKIYKKHIKSNKEEGILENPIVEKTCEKCGHDKMSYVCRQTRSADEGQTVFYKCLKCNNNIVENA
ncbi:unnamed protein product [Thelazia callipaeda]|uniref:DNA-directed RNA polymerase subunit n=1 Tax=Thelazia callipaeda TaxID=103827 RepID=A0A0N5CUV3_THECL|nr:unnamed protein product [Thelazia callipaeda]